MLRNSFILALLYCCTVSAETSDEYYVRRIAELQKRNAGDAVYANRRLITLQTKYYPEFKEAGFFRDTKRGENVLLVVKITERCSICRPMIWRKWEGTQLVQFESHNCYCGKKEVIERSRHAQARRAAKYYKKEQRRKREAEAWQRKVVRRIRQVTLSRKAARLRYGHYGQIGRHGYCKFRCCRRY